MGGEDACYRPFYGGLDCPGEMFGANAPATTWHMTFDHANLGPVTSFVPVSASSPFNSQGNGQTVAQPKDNSNNNGKKKNNGGKTNNGAKPTATASSGGGSGGGNNNTPAATNSGGGGNGRP